MYITYIMKITDDYNAKLKMWANNKRVVSLPRMVGIPKFGCRRFSSGDEMNAWKKELLSEIARKGGVGWMK